MVSGDEVAAVALMMRVEIDKPQEYAENIQKMLDFFDTLDEAGIDEEPLKIQAIPLDSLRDDTHVSWSGSSPRRDARGYIRAPGLG